MKACQGYEALQRLSTYCSQDSGPLPHFSLQLTLFLDRLTKRYELIVYRAREDLNDQAIEHDAYLSLLNSSQLLSLFQHSEYEFPHPKSVTLELLRS